MAGWFTLRCFCQKQLRLIWMARSMLRANDDDDQLCVRALAVAGMSDHGDGGGNDVLLLLSCQNRALFLD